MREAVSRVFLEVLGREPDTAGLEFWLRVAEDHGIDTVRSGLVESPEHKEMLQPKTPTDITVFKGYEDRDVDLLRRYVDPNARAEPGFVTDFIGRRVRAELLWSSARGLEGQLLGIPVPADYHAEAVEWVGTLKAVDAAFEKFRVMELGAGFGPWSVSSALGAKLRGIKDIRICAVEADPQHFSMLKQHLSDNGFDPDEQILLQAAVGATRGLARWPILEDSRDDWGTRPTEIDGEKDYLGRSFEKYLEVEVLELAGLLQAEPIWDLCHIDVQGAEVEICESAIDDFNSRVRWVVIGTHSRSIDGRLIELFWRNGWCLEHEKPAQMRFSASSPTLEAMTFVDGAQVWRNLRL